MDAIIRHLTSGEHFLAEINNEGDAVELSGPLPVMLATDRESGVTDWDRFEGLDLFPLDVDDVPLRKQYAADKITIVHTFA